MKYQDMSIEALEALNEKLTNERLVIKGQQREIAQVLNQKYHQQALQDDIEALQNKHGVHVLTAPGIDSAEAVGEP